MLGGNKGSLGTLLRAGLLVPPGFAVWADCYRMALDGGQSGQLDALVARPERGTRALIGSLGGDSRHGRRIGSARRSCARRTGTTKRR